ncbi:MAG TPA: TIGR03618 family F420-dependent PPOX class oxidoreductase [Chloroflexota bacterium]|nr:TIGR03618 family F420-dependent PPOX class oxidoreductase [Chloroflexota bacterium]
MLASSADLEAVKQFAAQTTRAVLVTRRKDGGLQSSPMSVVVDDDGNVLTATRARNAKTHNLARDPSATLCLFTERWPGPWMQVEGAAEIERLPEAMALLADYYRRRGQDTTTDAFRERMLSENRVLIRVKTSRVVRPAG